MNCGMEMIKYLLFFVNFIATVSVQTYFLAQYFSLLSRREIARNSQLKYVALKRYYNSRRCDYLIEGRAWRAWKWVKNEAGTIVTDMFLFFRLQDASAILPEREACTRGAWANKNQRAKMTFAVAIELFRSNGVFLENRCIAQLHSSEEFTCQWLPRPNSRSWKKNLRGLRCFWKISIKNVFHFRIRKVRFPKLWVMQICLHKNHIRFGGRCIDYFR